jgi:hypothetical protein
LTGLEESGSQQTERIVSGVDAEENKGMKLKGNMNIMRTRKFKPTQDLVAYLLLMEAEAAGADLTTKDLQKLGMKNVPAVMSKVRRKWCSVTNFNDSFGSYWWITKNEDVIINFQ